MVAILVNNTSDVTMAIFVVAICIPQKYNLKKDKFVHFSGSFTTYIEDLPGHQKKVGMMIKTNLY